MTTQTITVEQVIDKAIELARANPTYVYESSEYAPSVNCSYVPRPGSPDGCIFGQALRALGVTFEELDKFEREYQRDSSVTVLLPTHLGIETSPAVMTELRRAQSQQDVGVMWGSKVLNHLLAAKWLLR